MINRKISESKLLKEVRKITSQEQFYEAILYETVMSLSNENIEESIKIIDEVILKYPYMRNTLRTALISFTEDFVRTFKGVVGDWHIVNHGFRDLLGTSFGEMCCPMFIEDIAKHYSLDSEIMNTFKFKDPFVNINFKLDCPNFLTEYHKGYLIKGILYKSSKILEKLYYTDTIKFYDDLLKILDVCECYTTLLQHLTPRMYDTVFQACSTIFKKVGFMNVLNYCHETRAIENAYKQYNVKRDGPLTTVNLYVSYLAHSHNCQFHTIDLINEFKLRSDKNIGKYYTYNLIDAWCENIINYLKIDIDDYLKEHHKFAFKYIHRKSSIDKILERVDMMKPISDSMTILQAAVKGENEEFVRKILEKHPELVIVRDSHGNYVFNYFKKADYLIGSNLRIFEMLSKEVIKRFPKNVLLTMLLNETSSRKSFYKMFYKNDIEGFTDFVESIHC